MQDLKQWLEKPTTSAGATLSAKEDLKWLESQKDLSAVKLNGEKGSQAAPSQKSTDGSGGGSGIAALFGCAGKRK